MSKKYEFTQDVTVEGVPATAGEQWEEEKFLSGTLQSCLRVGYVREVPPPAAPKAAKAADAEKGAAETASTDTGTAAKTDAAKPKGNAKTPKGGKGKTKAADAEKGATPAPATETDAQDSTGTAGESDPQ